MENAYGIAAYRSRQQVLKMNELFRRNGIASSVVSTPKEISAGCGLSVRFDLNQSSFVKRLVQNERSGNLIGLYMVRNENGVRRLSALTR